MKTLIVYLTKHDCTEKCADILKNNLSGVIELLNLKKSAKPDLNNYGTSIIGGSIHVGQIQKKIKRVCLNHLDLLCGEKIGLFICCMEKGEKAGTLFNNSSLLAAIICRFFLMSESL